MPNLTAVGNELAELPLGDLLHSVAQGIADGQRALDMASLQTLIALSKTPVPVIPEVTEVITPEPFQVNVSGQPPIQVTGARVTATPSPPIYMNALQAGITPTFYQFTEATIQVKISVQLREVEETTEDGKKRTTVRAFGSNVNFRTQNKYSYSVDASSSVTATLRPVPPPSRLTPSTVTVNALGTTPTVVINP
jgi:hypothetical protein